MSPSHQYKLSRPSIERVFGYRRRSMTTQEPSSQQHVQIPPPPPPEHRRSQSNNGSSSGTISSSSSRSSINLEPSPHIAEWCHQMHMIQNKKYDWCHGCHPKIVITPANIPNERVMQYQQRRNEATHAYQ